MTSADSGGAAHAGHSLRSFNLLRLRAIEDQRNFAAITFDAMADMANTSENEDNTVTDSAVDTHAGKMGTQTQAGLLDFSDSRTLQRLSDSRSEAGVITPHKIYLSLDYLDDVNYTVRSLYQPPPVDEMNDADDEEDWLSLSIVDLRSPLMLDNTRHGHGIHRPLKKHHHPSNHLSRPSTELALSVRGHTCGGGGRPQR